MIPNAEMLVSVGLLQTVFDLPDGVEVVGVARPQANDWRAGVLRLAVTVDFLPSIEDQGGGRPYIVTPIFKSTEPGKAHFHELHVTPPDPAGTG